MLKIFVRLDFGKSW